MNTAEQSPVNLKINIHLAVLAALAATFVAGCLTHGDYRSERKVFLRGSDKAVTLVRAGMTESNAVSLLGKYVRDQVAIKSTRPSSAFEAALRGGDNKLIISTTGFSYAVVSSEQVGNKASVSIGMKGAKFADVTEVAIQYHGTGVALPAAEIILCDRNAQVLLSCSVYRTQELVPRVLAAIEILCPNIGKVGADASTTTGEKQP